MPWIVPFIPLIAAGATAGVGIGEIVNSDNNSAADQAAQKAQLKQEQQSQANQANLTKQEAVLGAQGQEQAQTGGSLTDPGTTALTDLLAGYPGYQSGSTSGGTPAISPTTLSSTQPGTAPGSGPPDITAILNALRGGSSGSSFGSNLSGGNWQTQPAQPSTYFELANPPV